LIGEFVSMPKVIVLDPLSSEGLDMLASAPGVEHEVRTGLKGDALRAALTEFDGAICRSGVKLDAAALEGNRRLKVIVRAGVGTDNIDLKSATRQGIVVMNTPAGNTLSTAEHTFAMMLALARNIPSANQSLCEGRWDRKSYMGSQVANKTLGIVGLGRIGQAVAARAKAFEMRVLGFDPFMSRDKAAALGIELYGSVDEMLPHVDFLTVHTPLTEETRNLVSAKQLTTMRKGVRLVNCARGGIYDEAAIAEGLRNGQVGGVALDVFVEEPCTNSPLFGMPNVVCTPHLGASTEEAQAQVAIEGVGLLVDFLSSGVIRHAVNMSPLDRQALEGLIGYLDVAYRLGLLHAQMDRGAARSCKLVYRGDVASKDTKLLTAAFCAGLLENALEETINVVNAELLLRERGIDLSTQSKTEKGDFSSLITADVTTDDKTYTAAGTIFGNSLPRLVRLGDHRLEAYLDGTLMIFTHQDVPGIIGKVGTIFGNHKVNIAQMAVGRASPGGEAIGVLNLDGDPAPEAMDDVRQMPDIRSATVIHLPPAGEMPPWIVG
jgi:D-3-phosphoglycerate dehydrogenase